MGLRKEVQLSDTSIKGVPLSSLSQANDDPLHHCQSKGYRQGDIEFSMDFTRTNIRDVGKTLAVFPNQKRFDPA